MRQGPLPRSRAALAVLTALVAGCAAAPPGPHTEPHPPVPYATFAFAGTPPVVDAEEEHVVRVGLARDTASLALVRRWLDAREWPPPGAVRPEDFTAALAVPPLTPPATVVLDAVVFASAFRPGWEVLALRVTTPPRAAPPRPTSLQIIVDPNVPSGATDPIVRSIEGALRARTPDAPVAPGARERRDLVPALSAALDRTAGARELVVVSDGAGLGGPDAQRTLLGRVAAARPDVHVTVVGVLGSGYDDTFLRALAQAGGGTYLLADATLPSAPGNAVVRSFDRALEAAWLAVDLDPGVVARWRLVGHENLVPRGPERPSGRALEAGTTTTLFIEVKRLEDGPRLGSATLHDGANVVGQAELGLRAPAARELADAMRLYAAAIFAEKLRGSYWVQRVPWPALAEATRGTSIAELVQQAAALDPRPVDAGLEPAVPSQHPLPSR